MSGPGIVFPPSSGGGGGSGVSLPGGTVLISRLFIAKAPYSTLFLASGWSY